jgi:hypothetical protein
MWEHREHGHVRMSGMEFKMQDTCCTFVEHLMPDRLLYFMATCWCHRGCDELELHDMKKHC